MIVCPHHDRTPKGKLCPHLPVPQEGYLQRFTGVGSEYDLLCRQCAKQADAVEATLIAACSECFQRAEEESYWDGGILGRPQVRIGRQQLCFVHETFELPELKGSTFLNIQPIEGTPGSSLGCTLSGALIEIDAIRRCARTVAQVPADALEFDGPYIRTASKDWQNGPPVVLRVSSRGELAALANTYGQQGAVLDLCAGRITMNLRRDEHHEDVSVFPLALAEFDDRLLVIHGTAWNRLDVSDTRTGVLLTQRQPTSWKQGEPRPPHDLDYFHSDLSISPDHQFIADNGWQWHPIGVITAWNLRRWIEENPWESEDGPTKKDLCWRSYYWDGPLSWIDDRRLCLWGYGQDDPLIPAALIFDVHTGKLEKWFPGPKGSFVFDDYLFSFDKTEGMTVWDISTGERLAAEPGFCPDGYHRRGKHFLTMKEDGMVQVSRITNAAAITKGS